MDCGVAAVSCMLSAFGIDANYEKLREACQTQVDGTSINSLEDLCQELGLDVCQHIVPVDLSVETMTSRLPVIAVTEPAAGMLHYVTIWRRVGDWLQVMDPRGGRMWAKSRDFALTQLRHAQPLSREDWADWFPESTFCEALKGIARQLLPSDLVQSICLPILAEASPEDVAALDAALRLTRTTARFDRSRSRAWLGVLFERTLAAAREDRRHPIAGEGHAPRVPASLWSIETRDDQVLVRGTVLLGVVRPVAEASAIKPQTTSLDLGTRRRTSLTKSILAVLGEQSWLFVACIVLAIVAISLGSALELLLYRVALDIPRLVTTPETRLGATAAFLFLFSVLLGLELLVNYGSNRLGRLLEMKLRMRTLWAIARVDDEFVKSRPTSDLAYRAQTLSMGALLVPSLSKAAMAAGDLVVTLVAIALLDPRYAAVMVTCGLLFVAAWLTSRTRLQEIDSRLQVHASRLVSLLLDGLRGIRPIRLHGYQDAFRDAQRRELAQWKRSASAHIHATSLLQARYGVLGVAMLALTFFVFLERHGDPRQFVILAFWSFRIPSIMTHLVQVAQTYPMQRNAVERLLEVTQYAPTVADTETPPETGRAGVAVAMRGVTLVLGGHLVLDDINLDIPSGQHLAVVGASGSGKSSLIGLLLGLHEPTQGEIFVDGERLDREHRQRLRADTMWIDPTVQLWNESIGANLDYASRGYARRTAVDVLDDGDLLGVLASVERGLDAPVGAEGAFVSGGEGQRIRIGRALFRDGTRLALLDEPFRGLDRKTRQRILSNVRRAAIRSSMVFVSHDIGHAMSFDRVLVVDQGKIVEDGSPAELSTQDSAFARLLRAEKDVLTSAWSGRRWRRLRIDVGSVQETNGGA
jgi:ATP-binding cassette subfamily B protein